MAIKLTKGGNISLTKTAPGLTTALVGLGWDQRLTDGSAFDLDAFALLLNDGGRLVDNDHFVYFNSRTSPDGSVQLSEDNVTGAGGGDDETLRVNLTGVSPSVTKIIIPVAIYEADKRGQNFGQVVNAFIRIVNDATGEEIVRYDLSEDFSTETALIFGELYRNGQEWKFRAIGQGYNTGIQGILSDHGAT